MSDDVANDLVAAVESGDVLAILTAQRRLLAAEMLTAAPGVKPQFSNELNKLHSLIREEQGRVSAVADSEVGGGDLDDEFDPSAI